MLNIKKKIAFNIVEQYHSIEDAKNAQNDFENKFQKRKLEDIDYIEISLNSLDREKSILELTHELLNKSKSEVQNIFSRNTDDEMIGLEFIEEKLLKEYLEDKGDYRPLTAELYFRNIANI